MIKYHHQRLIDEARYYKSYLSHRIIESILKIKTRAGSLNHLSGEPDRGEPTFHQ